ncbi:MAG: prepilin-type N-terminal cleavage/methylation domain-containing protein [Thermodesulfovibrionales bacterium]|nr:prepilin-type N-terminal cleavage/methylation domain-containing protein [Thermodesulfovibrionales bacterium]
MRVKLIKPIGNRGVTLVELIVVISIIAVLAGLGVMVLSGGGLTTSLKAKSNAEDIRLYLNYSRIASIGAANAVITAFNPTEGFYYACIDNSKNNDCTASEQTLTLSKPDSGTNDSGETVKGVKLKYDAAFGTFSQGGNPSHIATKTLMGGAPQRNAEGIYYLEPSATDIPSGGMSLQGTAPARAVFRRNGSVSGSFSGVPSSGSLYIYLKKDDETSYHHAINVNRRGKVDLYHWAQVSNGASTDYRWKLISTK